MKRADVKAGIIYAARGGGQVVVDSSVTSIDGTFQARRRWVFQHDTGPWQQINVHPRDIIAPLEEYERRQEKARAQRLAERRAVQEQDKRTVADRCARVAAMEDVLLLTDTWRSTLGNRGRAEVPLEWLEEIAGRLRGGA